MADPQEYHTPPDVGNFSLDAPGLFLLTTADTNVSNATSGPMHEVGRFINTPEAFVVPIVFALIFIVGVVGNGTLIFTVIRNKNMRNTPNVFIVSLAIGDLLLILASVPFTATIYTFTEWPYGNTLCKSNEFLQALSLGVSVFTLTALSGDRYIAIVYPMSKHKGSPLLRTCLIAAIIWIVSLGLAVLEAVAGHVQYHSLGNRYIEICDPYPLAWGPNYPKFHAVYRFVIYFALPMVIIGTFYLLMARILVLSSRHLPGEGAVQGQAARQLEARKKVAKLVLSFVVVFVVCWLPRHVYILWFHFDPGQFNLFWHIFKIIGFCMSFINSCVNPLALYFLSKQFRRYYNRYLFCCCTEDRFGGPGPGEYSQTSTMYNAYQRRLSGTTTMSMTTTHTDYRSNTTSNHGNHHLHHHDRKSINSYQMDDLEKKNNKKC